VVKRTPGGVAFLFRANGVTWVKGTGTFTDAHTLAADGGEHSSATCSDGYAGLAERRVRW
jgi:pyruvate/2-oxoglutarate dehydrogenase complex dihydrolipoamide dehydrogenase (E3) component